MTQDDKKLHRMDYLLEKDPKEMDASERAYLLYEDGEIDMEDMLDM